MYPTGGRDPQALSAPPSPSTTTWKPSVCQHFRGSLDGLNHRPEGPGRSKTAARGSIFWDARGSRCRLHHLFHVAALPLTSKCHNQYHTPSIFVELTLCIW